MNLASLDRWSGTTLAALRVLTGAMLIARTWQAMPGSARVAGIASSLTELDLPSRAVLPPLVAALEFIIGVLLVLGLLTRGAGLALAVLVTVMLIRTGLPDPLGGGWPRLILLALALHFAAAGPGRWALDGLFAGRGKRR